MLFRLSISAWSGPGGRVPSRVRRRALKRTSRQAERVDWANSSRCPSFFFPAITLSCAKPTARHSAHASQRREHGQPQRPPPRVRGAEANARQRRLCARSGLTGPDSCSTERADWTSATTQPCTRLNSHFPPLSSAIFSWTGLTRFSSHHGAAAKATPKRRGTARRATLAPAKMKPSTAVRSAPSLKSGQ